MLERYKQLPAGPMAVDTAVQLALDYCNFGCFDFCEHVCARILQADPGNLLARLVRGLVTHKRRNNPQAIRFLEEVTRYAPCFPDGHLHLGNAFFYNGQWDEAAAAFSRALELRSDYAEAMAGLGEIHRQQGQEAAAFALLQQAVALKPHYSPSYISYSLMCFDRSLPLGQTLSPRRPRLPQGPRLTMASLGNYGRFAQTVHEYVAVRLYAERYGLSFETPDWVGHRFFALDDPLMPDLQSDSTDWLTFQRETFKEGFGQSTATPLHDRDLFLGGSPVNILRPCNRERIQSWLTPRSCWRDYLEPPVAALRRRGQTLIALHIRRTDWWGQKYTPLPLYHAWLEQCWSGFADPVLFICTDDPAILPEFARYRPATAVDYPLHWEGLEYLQDFHVISAADVVVISTGAFAMTAAALNRTARQFLRPLEDNTALESFDPWTE